jgi:hypothetical protein
VSVEAAGFALHEVARRRGLAEVGRFSYCTRMVRRPERAESVDVGLGWTNARFEPQAARHLSHLRGRDEKKT